MMGGRFKNATMVTVCEFVTIILIFRHDIINAINATAGGGVPPPVLLEPPPAHHHPDLTLHVRRPVHTQRVPDQCCVPQRDISEPLAFLSLPVVDNPHTWRRRTPPPRSGHCHHSALPRSDRATSPCRRHTGGSRRPPSSPAAAGWATTARCRRRCCLFSLRRASSSSRHRPGRHHFCSRFLASPRGCGSPVHNERHRDLGPEQVRRRAVSDGSR